MDCKTARLLLHFARPLSPELDSAEHEALTAHLADCAECQQLRHSEQQLDARIGQAMRAVPLPPNLRERILHSIDVRHRAAHRPRLLRMAVSLAASLLLVAVGWYFWSHSLTRIDLEAMDPEAVGFLPDSAEQIEQAFRERGIVVQAPARFNYGWLTYLDTTQRWGRQVPFVHLQRGGAFVRIYLLDGEQFDLNHLEAHPMAPSGRVMLKWLGRSPDHRFGYLVEYTGPSLEPFLNSTLPAT